MLFFQSVGSTEGPQDLSEALSHLQGRRQKDNGALGLDMGPSCCYSCGFSSRCCHAALSREAICPLECAAL